MSPSGLKQFLLHAISPLSKPKSRGRFLAFLSAVLIFLGSHQAFGASLSFNEKGILIDNGSSGSFSLTFPTLADAKGTENHKILNKSSTVKTGHVDYDGGGSLNISLGETGEIYYAFSSLPADVANWDSTLFINISFQQGGQWKVGDGTKTPFPAVKPAQPHLYQGHASGFQVVDPEGKTLSIDAPAYTYFDLTDNRAWNWPIFALHLNAPYIPNTPAYTLKVESGIDTTVKVTTRIDEFGQFKAQEWPDKVESAEELKADAKADAYYYASLHPPEFDKFGGLPDSQKKYDLDTTGFFHIQKKREKWFLVDPLGNAFFHLGVCAVCPGDDYTATHGRESLYDWLPPVGGEFKTAYLPGNGPGILSFYLANTIRKFGQPYNLEDYSARMIDRLRKWGFNSIGAFSASASTQAVQKAGMPYVSGLPLTQWDGGIPNLPGIAQTWDPFDEGNRAKVEKAFSTKLPPHENDPLLIGYFLSNEPIYEDIPKIVPTLKGNFACKRVLVHLLSDKYKTIDSYNAAWGASAKSFDELNDTPLLVKTSAASADVHDFTGKFFESYYQLVDDTFHKYDHHHLLLGNRFQPGTINNEQLCRIAGKHLDIISFNYYTNAIDKDFLNRIYQWTGRPMMLSEFTWTCPKQSGLAGGGDLVTEQERGLAYRNYVEQAATFDYIIGSEWFTLVDQAATGRWFQGFSGEGANTGLISVTDRPWKPMLAEMMKTNYRIYDYVLSQKTPYQFDNPIFTLKGGNTQKTASVPRATGPIKMDGATENWPTIPPNIMSDRNRVQGSADEGIEGTFRLCWDDANLYIQATVNHPTPMQNKQPRNRLWSGDGIDLFLGTEKLDAGGQLLFSDRHVILGAAGQGKAPFYYSNSPSQYACDTIVVPGSDGKSYTLEAAIPWEALGTKPQVGQELLFDLAIDASDDGLTRLVQLVWNGGSRDSGDRTHWGRIKLLP